MVKYSAMKNKILFLIIFILLIFTFTSCNKKEDNFIETLTIYTINDFHGSLEEDGGQYGAARIANYIKNDRADKQASIVVSAGDMFQGSAISNYNHGSTVIDIMNNIGFDAMTIGNHEFDWSLDTVLAYNDGDITNNEANFPFLGANIIEKATGSIPNHIEPYTIIEMKNLKIGLIGYIGAGQETDILASMVEPYYFADPFEVIKEYTYYLRTQEECNIIITIGHDATPSLNKQISSLSGDYAVDCMINGHSHTVYSDTYRRPDGITIPCIQTGSAGNNVGVITLSIDKTSNTFMGGTSFTKKMNNNVSKDIEVENIINDLVEETAPVFKRILCTAGITINRNMAAKWSANAVMRYADASCAFINLGGIRSNAFPIEKDEKVDVAKVYQIMPFDNVVVIFKLEGRILNNIIKYSGLIYSDNIINKNNQYYLNDELIEDEKLYVIASTDFVFETASYGFMSSAKDVVYLNVYEKDVLVNDLEQIGINNLWFGK